MYELKSEIPLLHVLKPVQLVPCNFSLCLISAKYCFKEMIEGLEKTDRSNKH